MKVAKRIHLSKMHDKHNETALRVIPGETFKVETELNGGDWLQSLEDTWSPDKGKGPNLTTCIYIEGAHPDDTLAVEILDIKVDTIGYTGFAGWRTKLIQDIYPNHWDIVTKTVAIDSAGVHWSESLTLPIKPMIGTIGIAPKDGAISNQFAGHHGGNMDVQEITKGTTIYFPVNCEGAILHIGDVHAIMGDGEINHGGGIECRSEVVLRTYIIPKTKHHEWLRLENDEYMMSIAIEKDMYTSFCGATRELIYWMKEDYHFDEQEAYLLLGEVMEAHCPQVFNPSYICKIAKKYLKPDPAFQHFQELKK